MSDFPGEDRHVYAQVWGLSDVGQSRTENQDAFLIAELRDTGSEEGFILGPDSPELQDGGDPLVTIGPRGMLLLVADGMGGAAGGAVAYRLATSVIAEQVVQGWTKDRVQTPIRFAHHLRDAVRQANARVHARALERPELTGMGTTATVAGILDGMVYMAQVGDSRAYLLRNGKPTQLTRDQSMVQELVDQGAMTLEEAERSVHRSVLLQALGTEPEVKVALTYHPLRRGDTLLLCSDGLSGPVSDQEIAGLVTEAPSPEAACSRLVSLANERGGPDNITVVIARFSGEGCSPATPDEEVKLRPFDPDSP